MVKGHLLEVVNYIPFIIFISEFTLNALRTGHFGNSVECYIGDILFDFTYF